MSDNSPVNPDGPSPVPFAALLCCDALVLLVATVGWGQDFLPYAVGAELVRAGQASSVMLPAGAAHLMDVDPAFRALGVAHGAAESQVTGMVSPPPSLLPALLLSFLPYEVAQRIWRLGLAAVWVAVLHASARRTGPAAGALLAFLLLPGAVYAVLLGQTTVLMAAAVVTSGTLGVVALASVGLFKLTPLLMMPAHPHWRVGMAVVSGALLTSLLLPWQLWADFLASASWLGQHTLPSVENVSVEATLVRLTVGTGTHLLPTPTWIWAVAGSLKLVALAAFVWRWRSGRNPTRLGWVAVLLLSPLCWSHYLLLLPLLLLDRPRWALGCAALVSVAHLGVFVRPSLLGHLGSAVFAGALACVIWVDLTEASRSCGAGRAR